jgi:hypothetical protein
MCLDDVRLKEITNAASRVEAQGLTLGRVR